MTLKLGAILSILLSVAISASLMISASAESDLPISNVWSGKSHVDLRRLGLSFVPNRGQFPEQVKFAAQAAEYDMFFLEDRIVFNVVSREPDKNATEQDEFSVRKPRMRSGKVESEAVELSLDGVRKEIKISGEGLKKGKVNYLKGDDPGQWTSDVETFDRIRYSDVFEGIDLVFYGTRGRVQYDFVVRPGADPSKIRLAISKNGKGKIQTNGDLTIETSIGKIALSRPISYQVDASGNRQPVDSLFKLAGKRDITFRLGAYDKTRELIIDPVLSYSTLLGGEHQDIGYGIKIDAQGNAYIIGSTRSVNFPTTTGRKVLTDTEDVFVTKLSPDGSEVIFSTITGGSSSDAGYDIDVDANGNIYGVGVGTGFTSMNPLKYYSGLRKAATGVNDWQGVYGMSNAGQSLSVSGQNPDLLYAGTGSNVYKSTDAGASWALFNNGLPRGTSSASTVAVSPLNSNLLFAGGSIRMFRSTNGGESWSPINFFFGTDPFRSIVCDRFDPMKVYATKGNFFFRSVDGGLTWEQSTNGLPANHVVYTVINHPTIPGYLLAATGQGVSRSLDSGATWGTNLFGTRTFRILFDSRDQSVVWLATLGGIFRGPLGGPSWTRMDQSGFPALTTSGFLQDPNNPTHFYASGNYSIVRSVDNGVNWTPFTTGIPLTAGSPSFPAEVNAMVFAGSGSSALVSAPSTPGAPGGSSFVFKLLANGNGFVYASPFPGELNAVAADPSGRAHVAGFHNFPSLPLVNPIRQYSGEASIAGGPDDGTFAIIRADGREFEFSTYYGGTNDDRIYDVALDPAGNIYLGGGTTSSGFPLVAPYRSTFVYQEESFITKLAPNGSSVVYSTFFGGDRNEGINGIAADDSGNAYFAGWTTSSDLPQGTTPGVQPAQDGGAIDAFAAKLNSTGSTLLYSTYIGGSIAETAYDIALGPDNEMIVVGDSTSVDFPTVRALKSKSPFLKSSDLGHTWRNDSDGMVAGTVYSIATHPSIPGLVLAGTDHGVFRSTDGGEIWTKSSGINTQTILEVVFDPTNPSIAYLGSLPTTPGQSIGGVYKSTDGGISWTATNSGIGNQQNIYAIAVDHSNPNIVYAGSNGFNFGYPLYKSVNGGQTWNIVGNVVNINDVTLDPTNPSIVYVASSQLEPFVFRSTNGGTSWSAVGSPTFRGGSVQVDPENSSRLYVGSGSGVFITSNLGANWTEVLDIDTDEVTVDLFDPRRLFAATGDGVYTSTDRGQTWSRSFSGSDHRHIRYITPDRAVPGVVHAGSIPYEDRDAFIVKLSPSGDTVRFSTLFGSSGDPNVGGALPMPLDYAYGVDVSQEGSVFVTGYTRFDNFQTTPGAASNTYSGMFDAYVIKLDESRRISGKVSASDGSPISGVDLELSGSTIDSAGTLLDGRYKFNHALVGGSFTITPRKLGFTFQPSSSSVSNIQADQTLNFVAIGTNVRISGTVTQAGLPVPGVNISVTGDLTAQQPTAADGSYSIDVPANGNYSISASKLGLVFDPIHQIQNVVQDTQLHFTARPGFIISGQVISNGVGMGGVPVQLSGHESEVSVTDSNGNFSFAAAPGGPYSVAPISSGVSFDPPIVNIEALNSPRDLLFQAVHPTFASGGTVLYVGRTDIGSNANYDVYSLTGGVSTNLTIHEGNDRSPVYSPNGQKIAFASDRDGNWEIYVMNADGSNQTRITHDLAVDDEPTWSPDSSTIAYVKMTGATNSAEVYTIRVDGENETRLTKNNIYEYSPAWSPDGAEIAFVTEQEGNVDIYAMDANGGIRRRVTTSPEPDQNPAWSPDASWIVFDSGASTDREIWKIRRSGGAPIQLTNNSQESRSPVFSSDGQQVVFVSLCLTPQLKIVPAAGGSHSDLMSCGQYGDTPHWLSVRQFAPFATIRGRLIRPNGTGLFHGYMTLTYADGTKRVNSINPFGFYRFSGVRTGEVFTITPNAKNRRFAPASHQMVVTGDVSELDFMVQE